MITHLPPTTSARADESGMAMITAILVSVVVLFLGMTASGLSDHTFSATRVDLKRVTTIHAADAGIDHAIAVLQTTPFATLPCAAPLARSLGGGAYAPDYSVTFTYYATYPVSGSAMACPLTANPAAVVLTSVGDSSDPIGSRREVEMTARLDVPTGVGAFDKAVFSDATIEFDNDVAISGPDPIVYTNGAYNCDNMQRLTGSVYAQTTAVLDHYCTIDGDLWAKDAVTANDNSSVGRDLISGTSSVTLSNASAVARAAYAATTITTDASSTAPSLRPNSPLLAPPTNVFPQVTYTAATAAAWATAGYTIKNYPNQCATALSDLTSAAAAWTAPTILRITGCRLDPPAGTLITIKENVAIVSDQGFNFGANTMVASNNGKKQLFLIVPYGSTCSATLGRITMGASMVMPAPLQTFFYTPCVLSAQSGSAVPGQLYGGTVRFAGTFKLALKFVGSVPGYTASSLNVDREVWVVFRREVAAGP
jgi:hypothetical protein